MSNQWTDLFKYTSGRWLIDEKHQLNQRYVEFNLDQLCRHTASLFSKDAKCTLVEKIEGNYNKALILQLDGNEVVAKIPCLNAGPPKLTIASEAATLKFLRTHLSVAIPEVLAWNSDKTNPVGTEYIIMEKLPGVPLAYKWDSMNILDRYKIIDQIVEMEKQLQSIRLPAYGSLYLRDAFPTLPGLPADLDPAGVFCIGPPCQRTWRHDFSPWTSFPDFALSICQRELEFARKNGTVLEHQLTRFDQSQTVSEYIDLLQKLSKILPILSRHPDIVKVSDSVLCHPDLHLGNILVDFTDPTKITGIIDWQSIHAAPFFLQARFPDFLRPPKGYTMGTEVPRLPEDYDTLSPEDQEEARTRNQLASLSKYYEMSCLGYTKPAYDALMLDRRLWEPFACSQPSYSSLVHLRNCLIQLSQDWESLGLPGVCPFPTTSEDIERNDSQTRVYQDRRYLWDLVTTNLCTDDAGWVPLDRWELTKQQNRELLKMYIETMSEELSPEEAARQWPFPPEAD